MEGEQNVNLIWCIISSVAVYYFRMVIDWLFFFFLKSECQNNYSLGINFDKNSHIFFVFFKPSLPPYIENNSAMVDLEKRFLFIFGMVNLA